MAQRGVSNRQADLAGERFREWAARNAVDRDLTLDEAIDALGVIREYRAMHAYPLRKVTVGVRQMTESRELGREHLGWASATTAA